MNDFRMPVPTTATADRAIQPGSEVVDLDGDMVGTVTRVDRDSFVVKRGGILGGTLRIPGTSCSSRRRGTWIWESAAGILGRPDPGRGRRPSATVHTGDPPDGLPGGTAHGPDRAYLISTSTK